MCTCMYICTYKCTWPSAAFFLWKKSSSPSWTVMAETWLTNPDSAFSRRRLWHMYMCVCVCVSVLEFVWVWVFVWVLMCVCVCLYVFVYIFDWTVAYMVSSCSRRTLWCMYVCVFVCVLDCVYVHLWLKHGPRALTLHAWGVGCDMCVCACVCVCVYVCVWLYV